MANNLRTTKDGHYNRHSSAHRTTDLESEPNRYHLYVALACPWAAGAFTMLQLKGLGNVISHSVTHPTWQRTRPNDDGDKHCGWVFRKEGDEPLSNPNGHGAFPCDGALIADPLGCASIRDVYALAGDTAGPYTTPVLFDLKHKKIVSNESMDILKILDGKFNQIATNPTTTFYPPGAAGEELAKLNEDVIYPNINNGVYRSGFATSQLAYDEAVTAVFAALSSVEERLGKQRFLGGDQLSWLDLRLFHTLVRFDPVYVVYFKCNKKRIADYPNLINFVRDIYSIEAVRKSINMAHIKTHYFSSHAHLNHYGIVPVSQGADLDVPHGRGEPLVFD